MSIADGAKQRVALATKASSHVNETKITNASHVIVLYTKTVMVTTAT
ncbi:dihydropteridine reductase [Vibrio thalassae]|uniref:Dihydropteridine reductase n=1 Tax=Vibrio thalassae TaxID=1243014 RepID=A0A240EK60_9VIBR|nr:hypothetical protein [Vibrio thalassae]SNX48633.1 dihydropteridine reductase [Vibrio thalassae]